MVSILSLIFVVFAAGDPPLAPEIVGKWYASGQTPAPKGQHGMSWKVEYEFRADGTFLMTGYPPISVEGKIKVLGREQGKVHVLLYERKMSGSAWPDLDDWALFSDGGNAMKLDKKDFTRAK